MPTPTDQALRVHAFVLPLQGHYNAIRGVLAAVVARGHKLTVVLCEPSLPWIEADRAPGGLFATALARDGSGTLDVMPAGPCPTVLKKPRLLAMMTNSSLSGGERFSAALEVLDCMADLNQEMCEAVMPQYDSAASIAVAAAAAAAAAGPMATEARRVAASAAAGASGMAGAAWLPDVILFDAESFCGVDVALRLGVPRVAHVGTGLRDTSRQPLNSPVYSSGNPLFMSFGQRVSNAIGTVVANAFATQLWLENVYARNRHLFGVGHHAVDSNRLLDEVPTLYNTHWGIEHPRPLAAHEFLVGHTADMAAEVAVHPLGDALAAWMDTPRPRRGDAGAAGGGGDDDVSAAAEGGDSKPPTLLPPTVYISFGTVVQADAQAVAAVADAIVMLTDAFSLRVVWATPPAVLTLVPPALVARNGSASLMLLQRTPQVALLFHPSTVGHVTHGGMNGIAESLAAGVPVVCVPFFSDQPDNCQRADDNGFGVRLDRETAQARDYARAVVRVVTDPAFARAARRASELNQFARGTDTALRVIEATAQFGDAFLASHEHGLPWYQRKHLDLWAVLAVALAALYACSVCCYRGARRGAAKCCSAPPPAKQHEE